MRIDSKKKLFVGVRVDNKMKEQLDKCPQRDRLYFEAEDARYLTVMRGADEAYIGKLVDGSVATTTLDDLRRNIMSLLNRICPARRDEDEVKVLAAEEGDPPPEPPKREREDSERGRGYY